MAEIAAEVHMETIAKTSKENENKISASNIVIESNILEVDEIRERNYLSEDKIEEESASNLLNCDSVLNVTIYDNQKTDNIFVENLDDKITSDNQIKERDVCDNIETKNDNNLIKIISNYPPKELDEKYINFELLNQSRDEVIKIFSETDELFSCNVECSDAAKDLIQRLLNPEPQKRLRSLISLQNIRFFKDFNFADVRTKKVAPRDVLLRYFPNGPIFKKGSSDNKQDNFASGFEDFDSVFI